MEERHAEMEERIRLAGERFLTGVLKEFRNGFIEACKEFEEQYRGFLFVEKRTSKKQPAFTLMIDANCPYESQKFDADENGLLLIVSH